MRAEHAAKSRVFAGELCLDVLDIALFDPDPKDADAATRDVEDRVERAGRPGGARS